jgi:hypothetical protein
MTLRNANAKRLFCERAATEHERCEQQAKRYAALTPGAAAISMLPRDFN